MTLQFKVINQTIHPANKDPRAHEVVSDSVGYLHTQFTFNSEWDGLIKSAVFLGANGLAYRIPLDLSGTCLVPHEVIKAPYLKITVIGSNLEDEVYSLPTAPYQLKIKQSGAKDGEIPEDPTPETYAIVVDIMRQQAVEAVAALEAQTAAELARDEAQMAAENAATVTIGSVTTGASGDDASINNVGTPANAILDFILPRGERGDKGDKGDKGDTGDAGKDFSIIGYYPTLAALQSAVTNPNPGDAYSVGTSAPYDIHIWDGINLNWSNNGMIQGPQGNPGPKGDTGPNAVSTLTATNITGLLKGNGATVSAAVKTDITALGIPAQDTTYVAATTSAAGLMSAEDKTKLNGIETAADVSVNADWNASSGKAQILNKPTIPAAVSVVNDLTSTSTTSALSAAQGKVLNDGKLDKSGGTMSGAVAMGGNKISGLGAPTANADAATKQYIDNLVGDIETLLAAI